MTIAISELTVPNRLDHLPAVVAYVGELARAAGFDEKDVAQIQLAVEEAAACVVQVCLELNADESFTVVCERTDVELRVRVREKGVPFDPARLPVYSPSDPLTPTGLSLFLMRKSMDEMRFANRGKQGMELCLVKRLRRRRIDQRLNDEEKTPFGEEPCAASTGVTVRRLLPEDAVEVSKCAYRAYGYTYNEFIYFPEKIVEHNRTGELVSFVAVADDGDLMGHLALEFAPPGARIAEAGVAFVKPAYRKLGVLTKLSARLIEHARDIKLAGIKTCEVTTHTIPQKTASRFGTRDCGVLLGAASRIDFKNLVGMAPQRVTTLLSYLPLEKETVHRLYPPVRYRRIVEQILARLEMPAVFPDSAARPAEATAPDVRLAQNATWNSAELTVAAYGDGAFETVHHMWRHLRLDKVDAIYVYLNMEDPRCATFAEECRSLGFFLAGVLPHGAGDRHALIMQYLNNVDIDAAQLHFYSPEAQDLARTIIADAPELAESAS